MTQVPQAVLADIPAPRLVQDGGRLPGTALGFGGKAQRPGGRVRRLAAGRRGRRRGPPQRPPARPPGPGPAGPPPHRAPPPPGARPVPADRRTPTPPAPPPSP